MFEFKQDDLRFNQEGRISPYQEIWLAQMGRATVRWGGATLWVGLAFLVLAMCLILGLFMMNEGTQKLLISASPILAAALCFLLLGVILFSLLGRRVTQKQAGEFNEVQLRSVEGIAKLGETFNPKWGSGYFLEIGEVHFGVDARNKFEEGERYRVYYGSVHNANLIFSYEKIS
jgi:hypothetical protein